MVKKQIPKEPNQNSSATLEFEFESLINFRKKKKKNEKIFGRKCFLFEDWLHFILLWHGLYLFSKWLVFVFLGKFYCEFSNYEAKFHFHHALCDSI